MRVLLVLGAGVVQDTIDYVEYGKLHSKPTLNQLNKHSILRVEAAYEQFCLERYDITLFSGGCPAPLIHQTLSEAQLMRQHFTDLLLAAHQPFNDAQMLTERESYDTYGNIRLSIKTLKRHYGPEVSRIIDVIDVPTHITHMRRVELTFHGNGFGRLRHIPVEYELTPKELEDEERLLRMHQRDKTGWCFGTLHHWKVKFDKYRGSGRRR